MSQKHVKERVGAWLQNPNIGRRTGVDIKAGKTIRKFNDGVENFDDYWTDSSEGEDSMAIFQKEDENETPASSVVGLGVKPMSPFSASSQTSAPSSVSTLHGTASETPVNTPKQLEEETPTHSTKGHGKPPTAPRIPSENVLNPAGNELGTISRPDAAKSRNEPPGSALSGFRTKKRLTYSHGSDAESVASDIQKGSRISNEGMEEHAEAFKQPSTAAPRRPTRSSPLGSSTAAQLSRVTRASAKTSNPKDTKVQKEDPSEDSSTKSKTSQTPPKSRGAPMDKTSKSAQNQEVVKSRENEDLTYSVNDIAVEKEISIEPSADEETPSKDSSFNLSHSSAMISPCFVALEQMKTKKGNSTSSGPKKNLTAATEMSKSACDDKVDTCENTTKDSENIRKKSTSENITVNSTEENREKSIHERSGTDNENSEPSAEIDLVVGADDEKEGEKVEIVLESEDDEFEILDTSVDVVKLSPGKQKKDNSKPGNTYQRKSRSLSVVHKGSAPSALLRRKTQPSKGSLLSPKGVPETRRKSEMPKGLRMLKTFSSEDSDLEEFSFEIRNEESEEEEGQLLKESLVPRKKTQKIVKNPKAKTGKENATKGSEVKNKSKTPTPKKATKTRGKQKQNKSQGKKNDTVTKDVDEEIENVPSTEEEHFNGSLSKSKRKNRTSSADENQEKNRLLQGTSESQIVGTKSKPTRKRKSTAVEQKGDKVLSQTETSDDSEKVKEKKLSAKKSTKGRKADFSRSRRRISMDLVNESILQKNAGRKSLRLPHKRKSDNFVNSEKKVKDREDVTKSRKSNLVVEDGENEKAWEDANDKTTEKEADLEKGKSVKRKASPKQAIDAKQPEEEVEDEEWETYEENEDEVDEEIGEEEAEEEEFIEDGIEDDGGEEEEEDAIEERAQEQVENNNTGDVESPVDHGDDLREELEIYEISDQFVGDDINNNTYDLDASKLDSSKFTKEAKQSTEEPSLTKNEVISTKAVKARKSSGKGGKDTEQAIRRSSRPRVSPVAWYDNEVPDYSKVKNVSESPLEVKSTKQSAQKKKRSSSSNTPKSTSRHSATGLNEEDECSPPIVKKRKGKTKQLQATPNQLSADVAEGDNVSSHGPVKALAHNRRSILRRPGTPRASIGSTRFAEDLPTYTPSGSSRKSNVLPRYSTASPLHINEMTCSLTPKADARGKQSKTKAQKIVKPGTPHEGVRRSRRTRVRPLDWVRNERIVYKPRKSGGFVISGVAADEDEEVVDRAEALEKLVKKKRRREKGPTTPRNLTARKRVDCNINARSHTGVMVVNPDTCQEVEIDCLRSRDTLAYRGPSSSTTDDHDPFISTKALLQHSFSAGKLIIRPLQQKCRQVIRNGTMVFYVIHGKVALTLHRSSAVMESGDFFFIPRGNAYSLENLCDKEAKLTFFHIKD